MYDITGKNLWYHIWYHTAQGSRCVLQRPVNLLKPRRRAQAGPPGLSTSNGKLVTSSCHANHPGRATSSWTTNLPVKLEMNYNVTLRPGLWPAALPQANFNSQWTDLGLGSLRCAWSELSDIWNPVHLDRIRQIGTARYVLVHTSTWQYMTVREFYICMRQYVTWKTTCSFLAQPEGNKRDKLKSVQLLCMWYYMTKSIFKTSQV